MQVNEKQSLYSTFDTIGFPFTKKKKIVLLVNLIFNAPNVKFNLNNKRIMLNQI